MTTDKAGKIYWDRVWRNAPLPKPADPCARGLNNYITLRFHQYFSHVFSLLDAGGKKLLEIGCARSAWLPYFAKEFGFRVFGIDHSEIGCQQALEVLASSGVKGNVLCADFFSPHESMLEGFDVVVSFGVVEHFDDTTACIRALARFLKRGGMLITSIPNFVGLVGVLQRLLNKAVYNVHVPLRADELWKAQEAACLKVLRCHYFLSANFGVINWCRGETGSISFLRKNFLLPSLHQIEKAIWTFELVLSPLPANRFLSPYIMSVAERTS